ncbi:hypothetical protein BC833DRAFT_599019, partial [Globomyces pollinis-pini]
MNICNDYLKNGSCRFGSKCKFKHESNAVQPVCKEFQTKGSCKFGQKCRFLHISNSKKSKSKNIKPNDNKNYSHSTPKPVAINVSELKLFARKLKDADPNKIGNIITQFESLWLDCWKNSKKLDASVLEILTISLAKIPYSAIVPPPPIVECTLAIEDSVEKASKSPQAKQDTEFIIKKIEIVLNVVNRLLKFEWTIPPAVVKSSLENLLGACSGHLSPKLPSHRRISTKINDVFEELDKSWTIRTKSLTIMNEKRTSNNLSSDPIFDDNLVVDVTWENATVDWLMDPSQFLPPLLPVMKVPDSKSQGVYDSVDNYFDTVGKLWIGLTFGEGHSATSPICRYRQADKECGHVLWPMKSSGTMSCRTPHCHQTVSFACGNRFHDYGLCEPCVRFTRQKLCGSPGKSASTHIYDGSVIKVNFDGIMYIKDFVSRKPPMTPIHWYSTRRLASPNLVAIVKLPSRTSSLDPSYPIAWGSVTLHDFSDSRGESKRREKGELAISILDIHQDKFQFQSEDTVAIIDCQTFVPEFIPILQALELQKTIGLPFQNGKLLNICGNDKQETGPIETIYTHSQQNIPNQGSSTSPIVTVEDIEELVDSSLLDPIIEIRRDPSYRSILVRQLFNLVSGATLDQGQLSSFISALRNPVHCTQGPPGTGKSYVGVVMVRALLLVRDLWMTVSPSIGRPPILVLSYKNHAIDEFLLDLIRIGGSSGEPQLARYSERNTVSSQKHVVAAKQKIQNLHQVRQNPRSLLESHSKILLSRVEAIDASAENEEVKFKKKLQYTAAVSLKDVVSRVVAILQSNSDFDLETSSDLKLNSDFLSKLNPDCNSITKILNSSCASVKAADFTTLYESVKKIDPNCQVSELMWKYMIGESPPPPCRIEDCQLFCEDNRDLCNDHCCQYCFTGLKLAGKLYCSEHSCEEADCLDLKLPIAEQMYCSDHACIVCLQRGEVAGLATDEPPRNACELHTLCCSISKSGDPCYATCHGETSFCLEHQQTTCRGITKKGNKCNSKLVDRDVPFCFAHIDQFISTENNNAEEVQFQTVNCLALTGKKKPCKGKPVFGMSYCLDHMSKYKDLPKPIVPPAIEKNSSVFDVRNMKTEFISMNELEQVEPVDVKQSKLNKENDSIQNNINEDVQQDDTVKNSNSGIAKALSELDNLTDDSLDESDYDIVPEELDDLDKPLEDVDEMEEPEYLQHMREVFQIEETEMDELLDEDDDESVKTEVDIPSLETLRWIPPKYWNWESSLNERWQVIANYLKIDSILINHLEQLLVKEIRVAKEEYKTAKIKANAAVYEGKQIIGGTIVGCIARLEAIRATNPFAILIEEASEVLEPLLFSCLGPSTCKLEMIGDHLQLQPSLMSKFDYEKINKVNISMFERLIRAPESHSIPSSVLSVQRRMRTNICDLVRDFYADITEIVDHEVCHIKAIARKPPKLLQNSQGKGLLVPNILPQVFFWSHTGSQGRAQKGLSKINQTEADMICNLAKFLVDSGVPKTSIAILTPYKGQLMLIRDQLKKPSIGLLSRDPKARDGCIVSTVDRFQGDEADICLISLVTDAKSQTPFVKLVNRMIVLLSRARIGMYIVGNMGYFESKSVEHWQKTLNKLNQAVPSDIDQANSVSEFVYEGVRVGPKLPICCPVHRNESTKLISDHKNLKLDFCQMICEIPLPCSHPCSTSCHWPQLTHNTKCQVPIESPCSLHPRQLACVDIVKKGMSIERSRELYKCNVKVDVQLPCSHVQKLSCETERDIAAGITKFPKCIEKSPEPFIYTDCNHSIECTCADLERFKQNPGLVGHCVQLVNFVPPCNHIAEIKCYAAKLFQKNQQAYVCSTHVSVKLPRCGHCVDVLCKQADTISSWKGQSCTIQNVVEEGVQYGAKDYKCTAQVTFKRRCGHTVTLPCEKAFECSLKPTLCKVEKTITNPICGHAFDAPCYIQEILNFQRHMPAVSVIDETVSIKSYYLSYPPNYTFSCNTPVSILKKCGHQETMSCSEALMKAGSSSCTTTVRLPSPLCGHSIEIPCNIKDLWNPWPENFIGTDPWKSVVESNVLNIGSLSPTAPPDAVKKLLPLCKGDMLLRRADCGHEETLKCHVAFSRLDPSKVKKCRVRLSGTLACGHEELFECFKYEDYKKNPESIICQAKVVKRCWNFNTCSQELPAKCFNKTMCCSVESKWICEQGHETMLKICEKGIPKDCPECQLVLADKLLAESSNSLAYFSNQWHHPELHQVTSIVEIELKDDIVQEYNRSKLLVIRDFRQWMEKRSDWERPLFRPQILPIFIELAGKSVHATDFSPKLFMKSNVMGIQVKIWNSHNLKTLGKKLKEDHKVSLLFGYGFSCRSQPPSLSLKDKSWKKDRKNKLGTNCGQLRGEESLVFWDPYTIIATKKITFSGADLHNISESITADLSCLTESDFITFEKNVLPQSSVLPAQQTVDPEVFSGTPLQGLAMIQQWDGIGLGIGQSIDPSMEKELQAKIPFPSPFKTKSKRKGGPFAGMKFLTSLLENATNEFPIKLLRSLEFIQLGVKNDAKESLDQYVKLLREDQVMAHPLLLIAMGRLESSNASANILFNIFLSYFPNGSNWLTGAEISRISGQDTKIYETRAESAKTMWQSVKSNEGCQSRAMEKLLELTGLEKVKRTCVSLFKSAMAFQKMSHADRQANPISINLAFLGNPGTGKTTVARLVAEILYDSGVRKKNGFVESSAQKLKDDGPDEFRKLIDSAKDGVLFIDEAYDLDPAGDFKGKPIVSELLTASENLRESLTVIIAGYEDDMHQKLYAYNDGLRSRFTEVIFEDFDQEDLETIWNQMIVSKNWTADSKIGKLVSRRLSTLANKKGFGNARAVRNVFEDAKSKAMARKDFDGELCLKIEDIVGENPINNPKLKPIIEEFESKIGWGSIKKTVKEFLELAQKNYRRELDGMDPLAVPMNRLFLGNPGTGKTTCAALYGKFLKHLGYLSKGDVVLKAASDFVGSHVGESATKTNRILEMAAGKVLVIDEAYSLDDSLYGKQVLDTLVEKVQGTPMDDMAVLLLGYETPIREMIRKQNPGLARRFPIEYAFKFEDYTDEELLEIFMDLCDKQGVVLSCYQVAEKAIKALSRQKALPNFGNVGSLKLLLQSAVAKATARPQHDAQTICLELIDIDTGVVENVDPYAPLDALQNVDNSREAIVDISNSFKVAVEEGSELPEVGHFVFRGSPGTGKTTVARVMADILFQLEVIATDRIIETSGLALTGEFVGQTKKKVTETLGQAKGSVLFIDEAYELGKGIYGEEAMTTLLAAMTDPEYKGMVIIIAGYPHDIDTMLNRNVGLKSRFT